MEASREEGQGYPAYRSLWVWLLLGWVVAYLDRTITGPVVSYMIDNDLALVADAVNPYVFCKRAHTFTALYSGLLLGAAGRLPLRGFPLALPLFHLNFLCRNLP